MTPNGHYAIAALMLVTVYFAVREGGWMLAPFMAYYVAAAAWQVREGWREHKRRR